MGIVRYGHYAINEKEGSLDIIIEKDSRLIRLTTVEAKTTEYKVLFYADLFIVYAIGGNHPICCIEDSVVVRPIPNDTFNIEKLQKPFLKIESPDLNFILNYQTGQRFVISVPWRMCGRFFLLQCPEGIGILHRQVLLDRNDSSLIKNYEICPRISNTSMARVRMLAAELKYFMKDNGVYWEIMAQYILRKEQVTIQNTYHLSDKQFKPLLRFMVDNLSGLLTIESVEMNDAGQKIGVLPIKVFQTESIVYQTAKEENIKSLLYDFITGRNSFYQSPQI